MGEAGRPFQCGQLSVSAAAEWEERAADLMAQQSPTAPAHRRIARHGPLVISMPRRHPVVRFAAQIPVLTTGHCWRLLMGGR